MLRGPLLELDVRKTLARMAKKTFRRWCPPKFLGMEHDPLTGYWKHYYRGIAVYLRRKQDRHSPHYVDWLSEKIYFKRYRPKKDDVILDFGAFLGYEAVYIYSQNPDVRYIAVEIQPSVYECLALTFSRLPESFVACPFAVGDGSAVKIMPTVEGVSASTLSGLGVSVPSLTWAEFCRRYGVEGVDFIKMNIEGAEAALLDCIDVTQIKRIAVSCHDFKARRGGEGEFATKRAVVDILRRAGFSIEAGCGESDAHRDWIYGEREY